MSFIYCEHCGGDWFKEERWVRLLDARKLPEAEFYREDSKIVYRCGDCGEPLNVSRYEMSHVFKP